MVLAALLGRGLFGRPSPSALLSAPGYLGGTLGAIFSDLGLRSIYHHKPERSAGHLVSSALAYQFVQMIRRHLQTQGITDSWRSVRDTLAG